MLIEGPARIAIQSENGIGLLNGRLSAVVPPAGHGFAVHTSAGRIVDLGTEFGVEVNGDGVASIEVFKGQVQAEPRSEEGAAPSRHPVVITEGQAADANGSEVTLLAHPLLQRFVRSLATNVTSLNVVDFINGGDGTTDRVGAIVAPATGRVNLPPGETVVGDHQYHRITELPAVDGAFVPDGSRGAEPVDSAADKFQFPATNNHSRAAIWAGMRAPWAVGDEHIMIGNVDYGLGAHRVIHIPSNSAFTLDLSLLRHLHPGLTLASFHAIVGNTADRNPAIGSTDVFVLVNGQPRFEQRALRHSSGAFTIDFPLKDDDRFITFATTDGNDDIVEDWIHYIDPQVKCVAK